LEQTLQAPEAQTILDKKISPNISFASTGIFNTNAISITFAVNRITSFVTAGTIKTIIINPGRNEDIARTSTIVDITVATFSTFATIIIINNTTSIVVKFVSISTSLYPIIANHIGITSTAPVKHYTFYKYSNTVFDICIIFVSRSVSLNIYAFFFITINVGTFTITVINISRTIVPTV
jgi:hypothetical protein